jgi:hypothetical protein
MSFSFRSVLIIFGVVGLILLTVPFESAVPHEIAHPILHGIRTGLAEALIIAVFLARTVDVYIKQRLAEEIARDVSPHMAAAALPKQLRDEIREISNTNLYNSLLEIEYILERIQINGEAKMLLKRKCLFTIKNVAGTRTGYCHQVAVQRPFGTAPDLQSITLTRAKGVLDANGRSANYEHVAAPGTTGLGVNIQATHVAWKQDVYIPSNDEAKFISETFQIFSEEDVEMFINTEPNERTVVKVSYPKDTSVTVTFCHRLRDDVDVSPKDRPTQWTFEKAMLPYQPIVLEWRRSPFIALLAAPTRPSPTGQ